MYVEQAELWRLRRFSLGAGLVLFTWSLAGIALSPEPRITPFGLPLLIAEPRLLPVGLALAAAYGAVRYFYYAISLGPSPFRVRRDLLDRLRGRSPTQSISRFERPRTYLNRLTKLAATPWTSDYMEMEQLAAEFRAAFPKFALARVQAKVKGDTLFDDDGDEHRVYSLDVTIPMRCQLAAMLQDIDYTAPVWFPIASIVYWGLAR